MNRKLKPTKSTQHIKNEQIRFMLEEIEQDIKQYKKIIQTKDKQLVDLNNILKAAKNSYQQVTGQNQKLKQYISDIKKTTTKTKTVTATILQAAKKRLFFKKKLTVKLIKTSSKYRILRKQRSRIATLNNKEQEQQVENNKNKNI